MTTPLYLRDQPELASPTPADVLVWCEISPYSGPETTAGTLKVRKLPLARVLLVENNLSDLENVATAKTNLSLATVATSGAYADLSGLPTLGELASEDWPDSDGSEYVAKNGAWAVATGGGGGGAVDSVFGRTGAVVAQSNDYTAAQVTNAAAVNAANTFTAVQTVQTNSSSYQLLFTNQFSNEPKGIRLNATDSSLISGSAIAISVEKDSVTQFSVDWANGAIFSAGNFGLAGITSPDSPIHIGEVNNGRAMHFYTDAQHAYTWYEDNLRDQDWAFGMGDVVLGSGGNRGFGLFEGPSFASPNLPVWWVRKDSTRVGFATIDPQAQVHIDQSSTSAAIPVLLLDQADVDEDFISFIGTSSAATTDRSLIKPSDFPTPGAVVAWLKVKIQDDRVGGIGTIDAWIPAYSTPTV